MAKTDIARRVYNHAWKLDPIVRSLLDTDFYKLLMSADDLGPVSQGRHHLFADQPHDRLQGSPRRSTSHMSCATQLDHAPARCASPRRKMIWLGGNTFLWPQADLRAGIPGVARKLPAARLRAEEARRPVRARIPRAMDVYDPVGDSRAGHHQRAALALGDETVRTVRARRALRPRQGPSRAQTERLRALPGIQDFRLRHAGAGTASCGSAGAWRR